MLVTDFRTKKRGHFFIHGFSGSYFNYTCHITGGQTAGMQLLEWCSTEYLAFFLRTLIKDSLLQTPRMFFPFFRDEEKRYHPGMQNPAAGVLLFQKERIYWID